jgi:Cu+-exporting ATPase
MTTKDPVCGMELEDSEAIGTSKYEGQTYYFCSAECKERFDEHPEAYASRADEPPWPA